MSEKKRKRHKSDQQLESRTAQTAELSSYYESLAFDASDGDKGDFLSGWQCDNPFVTEFLADIRRRCEQTNHQRYVYFDDDDQLLGSIQQLHAELDGVRPESVLPGSGSTGLMFAFITYLRKLGIQRVYFLPPLYFTLHVALVRFGIEAVPVASCHAFEDGFSLRLPSASRSTLLITDPIWYAGVAVPQGAISQIADWQRSTSSIVFIDGSLQYLPWNGFPKEATAGFDPSLTFRLLCPSKQLCVHGYRFSYILCPASSSRELAWTYSNICGPASADSVAFAYEAIRELGSRRRRIPQQLMNLVSQRHACLRAEGAIQSTLTPHCGYFVFERIGVSLPKGYHLVDGRFFEQPNFPGYFKVNLLSPSLPLLSPGT